MTQEEQRLAIAQWCGWTCGEMGWWSHPTLPDNGGAELDPPDYANDLNAMHEAEKKLFPRFVTDGYGPDNLAAYRGNLDRICVGHPGGTWRAAAAQRCEALCRTLWPEKWTSG